MNREIKFRAWDEVDKIMRNWNGLTLTKDQSDDYLMIGYPESRFLVSFDHVQHLMQYTGLEDGARSEIYESDILFDPHYQAHGVVYFDEGCFRVDWDGITEDLFENCEMYVITGNIYENPELLEQSND